METTFTNNQRSGTTKFAPAEEQAILRIARQNVFMLEYPVEIAVNNETETEILREKPADMPEYVADWFVG